jgi:hypothetical protein
VVSIAKMVSPSRAYFCVSVALLTHLLSPSLPGQDALQLFHKMQTSLGGADKIASIRDFEESVHAQAWHTDGRSMGEVRKRTRWIRPNILRLDQVGAEDTYVLYFDGTAGWEILPDKPLANLDAGDLKFAHNYVIGIILNLWLADRNPSRVITSSGPNVIVVSTKGDSSQKTELTLDPATSLPMKETDISLSDPNHPVTHETKLEQWRAVDGVKFPHLISKFQGGTKLAEIAVEQIKLNRGLKAADLSVKPRDQKPVMSQP